MRWLILALAFLSTPGPSAQDRLALRVLYAGDPDIDRTEHWLGFLRQHATSAVFVDRQHMEPESLRDIDVVLIDGDIVRHTQSIHPGDVLRYPGLELLVGVPTVLIGNIGAAVGGSMQLKTSGFFG